MSSKAPTQMEQWIAGLLGYGTWLASLVILAGLIIAFGNPSGMGVAKVGIGLLILLPVLRVVLALLAFFRDGDYRLAIAAALVLSIIIASVAIALHSANGAGS